MYVSMWIGLNQQRPDEQYDSTALEAYTPMLLIIAMSVIALWSNQASKQKTNVCSLLRSSSLLPSLLH
jgi:hypothetical protein